MSNLAWQERSGRQGGGIRAFIVMTNWKKGDAKKKKNSGGSSEKKKTKKNGEVIFSFPPK